MAQHLHSKCVSPVLDPFRYRIPFAIGSRHLWHLWHLWCWGSQPRYVSNPGSVIQKVTPVCFMIHCFLEGKCVRANIKPHLFYDTLLP